MHGVHRCCHFWQNILLRYEQGPGRDQFHGSDNVIPGRGWRPSSLAGGRTRLPGRSAQPPSCADRLQHAATVTSYVRMRSSSVGLALVARARDHGPAAVGCPELAECHPVPPRGTEFSQVLGRRVSGSAEQWPCSPADLLHNGMQCVCPFAVVGSLAGRLLLCPDTLTVPDLHDMPLSWHWFDNRLLCTSLLQEGTCLPAC